MIPAEHAWLFWEVDPAEVDLERHQDYVLERVMTRGDLAAMKWLLRTFPATVRAEFLHRRADRLTPRDVAFWAVVSDVAIDVGPGGGRPTWAG